MTSFKTVPLAEGDLALQSGKGHEFQGVASFNPTWCDLCRDLIWGLYDTGKNVNLFKTISLFKCGIILMFFIIVSLDSYLGYLG